MNNQVKNHHQTRNSRGPDKQNNPTMSETVAIKREREEGAVAETDAKKTKCDKFCLTIIVIDECARQTMFANTSICDDKKECYRQLHGIMHEHVKDKEGVVHEGVDQELLDDLKKSAHDGKETESLIQDYFGDSGEVYFNFISV